jgi:dolichol kinase
VDVIGPRVSYCLIHLAGLLFAIYRVALMGLLPINVGDWSGSIVGGRNGDWVAVRGFNF